MTTLAQYSTLNSVQAQHHTQRTGHADGVSGGEMSVALRFPGQGCCHAPICLFHRVRWTHQICARAATTHRTQWPQHTTLEPHNNRARGATRPALSRVGGLRSAPHTRHDTAVGWGSSASSAGWPSSGSQCASLPPRARPLESSHRLWWTATTAVSGSRCSTQRTVWRCTTTTCYSAPPLRGHTPGLCTSRNVPHLPLRRWSPPHSTM